ncbi:hypothetical protein PVK06_038556 [Gossypium arboreum]|uniref:RNase H type-1 domain-containing protein n=1 Tax=Gossypium arboreum TaxID=29729 RepID=A0ABR0N0H0_GOSAR|nr:hypothetical protein PVK06_038556 [Gossypium arboreum]
MPAVAGGIYLCATASVAKTTVGTGIRAWRSIPWNPPPTEWLKTMALWRALDGVDQAWEMGYRRIMLELDSSIAVNAINSMIIGSSEIRSLDIFRSYWAENGSIVFVSLAKTSVTAYPITLWSQRVLSSETDFDCAKSSVSFLEKF